MLTMIVSLTNVNRLRFSVMCRVMCSGPVASQLMQVRMNLLNYYSCLTLVGGIDNDAHICLSPVSRSISGVCLVSVCLLLSGIRNASRPMRFVGY